MSSSQLAQKLCLEIQVGFYLNLLRANGGNEKKYVVYINESMSVAQFFLKVMTSTVWKILVKCFS